MQILSIRSKISSRRLYKTLLPTSDVHCTLVTPTKDELKISLPSLKTMPQLAFQSFICISTIMFGWRLCIYSLECIQETKNNNNFIFLFY
jgi:hypothetical protein